MIRFLQLCVLLGLIGAAAWLEADYAARHWPNEWAGYCTDAALGPTNRPTTAAHQAEAPMQRYRELLTDLELRVERARAMTAADWAACAVGNLNTYRDAGLWQRFGQPAVAALRPVDEVQAARAAERILLPLERLQAREQQWLETSPSEADVALRLRGRHWVRVEAKVHGDDREYRQQTDGLYRLEKLMPGLVSTLAEMNNKAALAEHAAHTLGRGTTVVASGLLLLWLALTLVRRPAGALLWIAPILLGGALLMVSLTLGAPPLRTVGVRALQGWNGLVWWPLLTATLGVVLAAAAQRDRWLGPWLVNFTSQGGLAVRTAVLCALAVAVAWGLDEPARRSELWLGLAVVGLALFAARNADVLAVTGETTRFGWPLVVLVGGAVIGMAIWLDDLGTAVLAMGMVSAWCLMFARGTLAFGSAATMAGLLIWWSAQIQPVQPLPVEPAAQEEAAKACAHLQHPRLRMTACLDISGRNDVFRSVALAHAGWTHSEWLGFGLVDLPANALAAGRTGDRVILQLPMDYIAAPWTAAFGKVGLLALTAYTVLLFGLGARTLATLQLEGRATLGALLAAIGSFGIIAAALRVLISSGGALAAIPLTGQPAPMLAYGTSAALAFGLYLGLAMGSLPSRGGPHSHHTN